MSGFDNGTQQGGVFFQAKQFGSLLRGFGSPVPQAGVVGDLYLDTTAWNLYSKRTADSGVDPWGHYLFNVPLTYRTRLKWFTATSPSNDIGIDGDYCLLWGGYPNYGLQPMIFGPKAAGAWPSSPATVAVSVNPLYTAQDTLDTASAAIVPVVITTSTYNITAPGIYYVDCASAVNITLLAASLMGRGNITVKDVSGDARTNVINIHSDASDTDKIDGLNPYVIDTDFGAVTLYQETLGWAVL